MYQRTTLDNGLRIASYKMPERRSVTVTIWVKAGSRYENEHNNGITHFIEHMLFKGSEKRPTPLDISKAIEGIGGRLNAFTAKEYTCYYARVMSNHLPLAMDVLTDMILNPLLRESDIVKERLIVQEEIKRMLDTPDDFIYELFREVLWREHPLGKSILGTPETVNAIDNQRIKDYMRRLYLPNNIIISVAGEVEHKELIKLAQDYFGDLPAGDSPSSANFEAKQESPEVAIQSRDLEQTHLCLGVYGFPRRHPDRYGLGVLSVVLGGNASSRLFQEIREKKGLAYAISSFTSSSRDTGCLGIYAGIASDNLDETIQLILVELDKIRSERISEDELTRGKEQIKGNFILGLESTSSYAGWIGEREIYDEELLTVDDVLERIDAVTVDDVLRIGQDLLQTSELNLALVGKVEDADKIKDNLKL